MDELDPRRLQELTESLYELTGTVKYTSSAMQSMLGPQAEANKKIQQSGKRRADVEEAATRSEEQQLSKKEAADSAQKKLFEDELRYRGYKLEKTGNLTKNTIELTSSQKGQLEALDKRISKERELAEVIKDPVKSFRNISGSVNSLDGVMSQMQDKLFEMTGKSIPMAMGLTAVTSVVAGVTKAALSMADSLYKGERGAKVGAKAAKELSDTITNAAYGISAALLLIPGLGIASRLAGVALGLLATATKGSTKLIEMGAEYNDAVYESFNKLSESGLTTAKGMSGVSTTMEKLGVTSAHIEKMNALLSTNSKDLALFGGTAAGGLEKFSDIAGSIAHPASELNKKLMLLGITSDEQREHTLKYMATQTRMGMLQNKTQADQIKGAVAYMEELDRIATITGIGRKEQEEAQKQVLAIEELRAAMFQAEKSGDTKRQAELEQAFKYSTRLMTEGRKKEAAGFAKYYAAGKNVVDAESAAAIQSSRGAMEAISAGKTGEDVKMAGDVTAKEALTRVAGTKRIGGDVSSQVLDFNATIDAVKASENAQSEMAKLGFKDREAYAKYLQDQKKEKPDPQLAKNVEVAQIQQKTGLLMDQAAKKMDGAALAMASTVKAFNDAVALFNKATGGSTPQGQTVEKAKAEDNKALEKQQAAMDANAKVKADANATKEQKAAAQKAEDDANKASQLAAAAKREAFLKEQNELRELNKKQRIAGKPTYKNMGEARAAGAAVAPVTAPTTEPATAPSTSQGAPETTSSVQPSTTYTPMQKEMEHPDIQKINKEINRFTGSNNMNLQSNKDYVSRLESKIIANEPVLADKPLSARQLSVIGFGIEQGNTYSDLVMKKYNLQKAEPVSLKSQPTNTETTVDINKAETGGIFTGPGSTNSTMGKGTMSTSAALKSLRETFTQVEKKSVESELPELTSKIEAPVAKPQKSNSVAMLEELTYIMEQKLSDVISAISDNNNIKEEILLYSKV